MGFQNKPHFQRLSWWCNLMLAILCFVTFAADIYINTTLNYPRMVGNRYAQDTPVQVLRQYMTQITPPPSVFGVCLVIYALFIIWFLYVFYLLLCRQSVSRDNKPPLFSGFFWFLFIIINVLDATWLYLFSRHELLISGIVLLVQLVTLYVLCILAYRICSRISRKNNNSNDSNDDNMELMDCEIVLLKFLTLNGIPLYAVWYTLLACLHWAIIFKYSLFHFSDNVACVLALALLSIVLVINWAFELLFQRKSYMWTWLPSLSIITFFIAIIVKHRSIGGLHMPGLFFAFILLVVTGIAMILKCCGIFLCYPKSSNPRFSRI